MLLKIFTGLLLSLCLIAGWLWNEYEHVLSAPVILNQAKVVEIKKGDSFKHITEKLIQQGIAVNPLWFKIIAYKDKVSNKLKAGEYVLQPGLTLPDILAVFVKGKTRQYSITFPEGWSFKQMLQAIQSNPNLENTLGSADFETIMAKLGSDYKHPEGLFFPDTYFFDKATTDLALLKIAYGKMQAVLDKEWQQRDKDLPIENAYQALILASIVEKETGAASERAQIAGVFTRRLKKGMLLQTDPTVIYGMGERYKGNIRYKDLRRPTAYNTYVIKGLPPTPIAMPGQQAIHAALHPLSGKSL